MNAKSFSFLFAWLLPGLCLAAQLSVSVPLDDGRLSVSSLRQALESKLNLPDIAFTALPDVDVSVNLQGAGGWMMTRAINSALGEGFHLAVDDNFLQVSVDTSKLPHDWNDSCNAMDRFTRVAAPDATARQARRFGLRLPRVVDPKTPLVVLIHGLDGDSASCNDLASLLHTDGFQTATFAYPTERPLAENAQLLALHMSALRQEFPNLHIDLVTESMGGLIARRYVEGPDYTGGVDHFILIAPPNEGSNWVRAGWALKLIVNAASWKNDPDWSPAWMITEGICQESCDLKPQSEFLQSLNSNPRRADVAYTIIAGNRPAAYRYEAKVLSVAGAVISGRVSNWWGFRQASHAIQSEKQHLLNRTGESDGPVSLASAKLAGVSDFVTIPVDHIALFECIDHQRPAAWPVIHDRLAH